MFGRLENLPTEPTPSDRPRVRTRLLQILRHPLVSIARVLSNLSKSRVRLFKGRQRERVFAAASPRRGTKRRRRERRKRCSPGKRRRSSRAGVKMRERKRGRFTHVNVLNLARILTCKIQETDCTNFVSLTHLLSVFFRALRVAAFALKVRAREIHEHVLTGQPYVREEPPSSFGSSNGAFSSSTKFGCRFPRKRTTVTPPTPTRRFLLRSLVASQSSRAHKWKT